MGPGRPGPGPQGKQRVQVGIHASPRPFSPALKAPFGSSASPALERTVQLVLSKLLLD